MDPNQSPEDLLRSYAHKRRKQAGSDWNLNSRARDQLQAEVARVLRSRSSEVPPWWAWLTQYRIRLALGTAAVALVLAGASFWPQPHQTSELRLAESAPRQFQQFRVESEPVSPTPAKDPGSLAERMRRFQLGARPGPRAGLDVAMDSSATAPPGNPGRFRLGLSEPKSSGRVHLAYAAPPIASNPSAESRLNQKIAATPALALATTSSPAPVSASSFTVQESLPANAIPGAANLLRFQQINRAQLYRQNFNSPPLPPVLNRFDFTVEGSQVRVLDADGSVYLGKLQARPATAQVAGLHNQPVTQVSKEATENEILSRAAPSAPSSSHQLYSFRASGTNRTLGREVVFTGEFEPGAAAPVALLNNQELASASQGAANQIRSLQSQAAANQAAPNQLVAGVSNQPQTAYGGAGGGAAANNLAGRIVGQASIGGKDELKIEAMQVAP